MAAGKAGEADVGADQCRIDMDRFAVDQLGVDALLHGAPEYLLKKPFAPALPDPGQAAVIRQAFIEPVTRKPADGQVNLRLPHQLAVLHQSQKEPGQHQPKRCWWSDTGPPVCHAISLPHRFLQPA